MTPSALDAQKREIRLKSRQLLQAIPSSVRKVKSRRIVSFFTRTRIYKNARKVLLYASFGTEPDTWALLKDALESGKEVYLPRVAANRKLGVYRVDDLHKDLVKGAFGIWEPLPRVNRRAEPRKMDVIVIPGLAFDSRGRRLGRGLGFYDRLLADSGHAFLAGLAFDEQKVRQIPVGPRDRNVMMLVTDKRVYRVHA